ncbi:chromophore lyase CpcT/CpeT [Psychroserpens ponticola]|uniref:Chromophore lyase CpcT/CpeT n=1 Tax=Psychroserpens ponticola TaxID=2932268 RepID=A0ABY7RZ15_9FLAO|nr:chromophore lyase CpcT/CpeT [Psychroserpens ponticola]WCO02396.1 chromophore lyase CpcT/CpeT [Psychroserpens ponticola]
MKYFILSLAILATLFNCKNAETKTEDTKQVDKANHLQDLFGMMQGSFSSEIQAENDSTYFNISLHMYPIWEDKGNFLYVEQALTKKQNKPYRQRVYEVTQLNDSMFSSAIYTIEHDSLWIGKWKTPETFDTLTMEQVSKKEGCEVVLKRIKSDYFKGETGNKTCESTLYGASYATSEVEILSDKIISWDRGFDDKDEHIWGAEKGGYIFNKID